MAASSSGPNASVRRVRDRPGAPTIVAIPVRDEAERIGACLRALAVQQGARAGAVILVVNNTRDGSAALAEALAPELPFVLQIAEREFPPSVACAGHARRTALEFAAALAPENAALLTTDADGQVAPDWLARNLAHLRDGAEAVAGRWVLDPADAALIPARLHEDDAQECAYAAVLDEITALLDPDPSDPMPRHTEHSGASICVTLDAYRRAGGMPASPLGEDRAFFAALRRVDARVRHATDVWVTVSGRIDGRAPGGMADTIRRRLARPDVWLDDALEPASAAIRRARLRGRFRQVFARHRGGVAAAPGIARELRLPLETVLAALDATYCGEAWAVLEDASPALVRARVAVTDLPAEMARAVRERNALQSQRGGASLPDLAAAAPA